MPNPVSPSRPFTGMFSFTFLDTVRDQFNLANDDIRTSVSIRRALLEKAAEGLFIEGRAMGQQQEAQWMAKQLLNIKLGTKEEIYAVCVRLYSMESFLYKRLNEIMRLDGDEQHTQLLKSKASTLGPFAVLLNSLMPNDEKRMTVYRGAQLSSEMIEHLKRAVGGWNTFPAFTSTSRNRQKAEAFGNVLFEIEIRLVNDISQYSQYPDEEEVLIYPTFCFDVQSLRFDDGKNKWIIQLRSG